MQKHGEIREHETPPEKLPGKPDKQAAESPVADHVTRRLSDAYVASKQANQDEGTR